MKIYLKDRNPEMAEAWSRVFKNDPDIDISTGDIFSGPIADAIISPANSFGFMDGGIDGYYSMRWPRLQSDLQEHLFRLHQGELPVGSAVVIKIPHGDEQLCLPGPWTRKGDEDFKWLVSAPTMRIPADVRGTVNAYLAFRAALMAIIGFNNPPMEPKIETVLCPGMCTSVGRMEFNVAAVQMYMAYKHVMKEPFKIGSDLGNAFRMHEQLRRGLLP